MTFSRTIKLHIEYDGTSFNGWQNQAKGRGVTVQGAVEKALSQLCKEKIKVAGSSRTDAGVHAFDQVATFKTKSTLPLQAFQKGLNTFLVPEVRVRKAEEMDASFHALRNAKGKIYSYYVLSGKTSSPIAKNHVYFFPYTLNFSAMKKAAKQLVGKHDFSSFRSSRSTAKTSVRTIHSFQVKVVKDSLFMPKENTEGTLYCFTVKANGFLHNQVRTMVGTLLDVGREKIKPEDIKKIISAKKRSAAGKCLPGHALYLIKTLYA
ncbi:MAG: tRNA pseudouridine(38-40) synthase TruA [Deltaproteobacteria bacterium CG_4_10_14_0_2_um_filter_43_8]|nr:MAG: tRNA pseudouridine(38-40) synthase TruA [Deltaproteobacteria bacterium CG11_big_fil_rev_8_21_14_0_20_42_23]PJA18757.1 MAG: tRNA pseudouridine(38-40) synthase TruA [Deltaproteobacteria bacterium CG_4_10_14_0_2_um_filter_43_8]PJC64391.1 MAG: tRNA pseudouridine(38-40) synthase TruA [Deltaproteobacteria bacterium CG_4_9_14_0_2_um_filter_42_21]